MADQGLQGLKVVGVDGRDEPLRLAASKEHAPNLCINAVTTTVEEALQQIAALRPTDWTGPPGVDGPSSHKFALLPY